MTLESLQAFAALCAREDEADLAEIEVHSDFDSLADLREWWYFRLLMLDYARSVFE